MSVTDLIIDPFGIKTPLQALLLQNPQLKLFLERIEREPSFRTLFFRDPEKAAASAGLRLKRGAAEKIEALKVDPNNPNIPVSSITDGTSNTIIFGEAVAGSDRSPFGPVRSVLSSPGMQWAILLLPYIEQNSFQRSLP